MCPVGYPLKSDGRTCQSSEFSVCVCVCVCGGGGGGGGVCVRAYVCVLEGRAVGIVI